MRLPLLALLALGGCEMSIPDYDAIGEIADPDDVRFTCADLDGTFFATDLAFTPFGDTDAIDFVGLPELTTVFRNGTFQSDLLLDEGTFATAGGFVLTDGQIFFMEPFVFGMSPGTPAVDCDFDGRVLELSGPTSFDFVDDPDLGPLPARLDATLVLAQP